MIGPPVGFKYHTSVDQLLVLLSVPVSVFSFSSGGSNVVVGYDCDGAIRTE